VIWLYRAALRALGHRWYYSTSCLHDQHAHCRCATAIDGKPKKRGECKWCPAVCICRCHRG
jgi:hypothetical protein